MDSLIFGHFSSFKRGWPYAWESCQYCSNSNIILRPHRPIMWSSDSSNVLLCCNCTKTKYSFSNYKVQHHATDTLVKLTSSVYTCFCNHISENVIIYNSVHTGKLVNFLYMVYLDTKTVISWYWNRYTIWLNVCIVYLYSHLCFCCLKVGSK